MTWSRPLSPRELAKQEEDRKTLADQEKELTKIVFSNQSGKKLVAVWEELYGNRISHDFSCTSEHTAFREGERAFYQSIRRMLDNL